MHSRGLLSFIAQLLFLVFSWLVWKSNTLRGKSWYYLYGYTMSHTQSLSDISGGGLVQLNDCTCLGYTQTFECNVCGLGSTIWSGTFFDCEDGIELRHSRYNGMDPGNRGPPREECNQGEILAKSIGVFDECYTSHLIVTIGEEMINGTIECIHDNFKERTIINQKSLVVTETLYPPPSNVHIESNDSHQITFAWDEVTVQCSSLQYIITAINCGVCPNTTADKNVTCDTQSDISQRTNNTCTLAVQTEICGHLRGNRSDYVIVYMDGEQYLFHIQSL
jgi:hypothetical protein